MTVTALMRAATAPRKVERLKYKDLIFANSYLNRTKPVQRFLLDWLFYYVTQYHKPCGSLLHHENGHFVWRVGAISHYTSKTIRSLSRRFNSSGTADFAPWLA